MKYAFIYRNRGALADQRAVPGSTRKRCRCTMNTLSVVGIICSVATWATRHCRFLSVQFLKESRGAYGWPRIWRELRLDGPPRRQAASTTAHAAEWHPSPRQAPFPDHRLRTAGTACRSRPTCWIATSPRLHRIRCGSAT